MIVRCPAPTLMEGTATMSILARMGYRRANKQKINKMDISKFKTGNACIYHGKPFRVYEVSDKYALIRTFGSFPTQIRVMLGALEGIPLTYHNFHRYDIGYNDYWIQLESDSIGNIIRYRYKYRKREFLDFEYNIETKKFSSVYGAKFDYIHQIQNYINSKIWKK